MVDKEFVIECEAQGIERIVLTKDELLQWLAQEEQFWPALPGIDTNIVLGNVNYGSPGIPGTYRNYLSAIKQRAQNDGETPLRELLKLAAELKIVLAHGQLGTVIKDLVSQNDAPTAQRLTLLFSEGILIARDEVRRELAGLRAALRFNPNVATTADLVSASKALKSAKATARKIGALEERFLGSVAEIKADLETFTAQKSAELQALHEQYETHLLLQGPSQHWKRIAARTNRTAVAALTGFVILLLAPTLAAFVLWEGISKYIDHIIDITKGGISLASLVVFTVPVLAYGWLLKHVSRIFTQNLMLSSDAEHRRVMAITFLGLAKRKSVGITEQDRALILNALFRPAPTSPQDDGPPSGLLELIKK